MLFPHEHGAYGQLLIPLVTALAIGSVSPVAMGLVVACVLGFLAHEPLLVLLGHRGTRARRADGARARRQLIGMTLATLLIGGVSAVGSPVGVQQALLVPLALALGHLLLIARHLERSVPGEMAAAVTLSSCALPVAMAGGAPLRSALTCWLVFAIGLALATLAVRAVIAGVRDSTATGLSRSAAIGGIVVLGASVALAARLWIPAAAAVALVPVSVISIGLAMLTPHPRHLRTIGWSLVATSLFSGVVLVVGMEGGGIWSGF